MASFVNHQFIIPVLHFGIWYVRINYQTVKRVILCKLLKNNSISSVWKGM